MKNLTQIKLVDTILSAITQSFNWKYRLFFIYMCLIFQEYPYFYQFYYRNDWEQNRRFIEKCEALRFLVANVILYMRGTTIVKLSIRWLHFHGHCACL